MSRNQLDQATSLYLLAHKDNPVHWRPWSEEALTEAQTSDKPILLSIGYTACHWCHTMNRESFSDAGDGRADERALHPDQGRPRGTPRHRSDLSGRGQCAGPGGRLAADHVPDTVGRTLPRRRLLPQGRTKRPGAIQEACWPKSRASIANSPNPSPTPPSACSRPSINCGAAICAGRCNRASLTSWRSMSASASTSSTAASPARPKFPSHRTRRDVVACLSAHRRRTVQPAGPGLAHQYESGRHV